VTRTADHWWLWSEEDAANMYATTESPSMRCRRWRLDYTDDGPNFAWIANACSIENRDAKDAAHERADDESKQ